MARYQVILAYDGTRFFGSQRQAAPGQSPGNESSRTVQGELEKALRSLGWIGRAVLLAGRTDSGVHATGQVAAFDLDWRHTDGDLLRALNANLPGDVAVQEVSSASADFHPRFAAEARRYRYRLFQQPVRDPLRERYAWRLWPPVNGEALRAVAKIFVGTHDFAAYGSPPGSGDSCVRNVMSAAWRQLEDEWLFEVSANAFLYHMVRRLVFVQVAVGQGKVSEQTVSLSLAEPVEGPKRSALPSGLAPAYGLTLVEVKYPER